MLDAAHRSVQEVDRQIGRYRSILSVFLDRQTACAVTGHLVRTPRASWGLIPPSCWHPFVWQSIRSPGIIDLPQPSVLSRQMGEVVEEVIAWGQEKS